MVRVPEPLVLLHGFGGRGAAWDGVTRRLDPERYRPLALDLPGHGRAPRRARPIDVRGGASATCSRAAPRAVHARAATRWAGASRCTSRWRRPSASRGSCSCPRAPGIEDADERAARRAADARLARRARAGADRGVRRALARAAAVRRRTRRASAARARRPAPQRPARAGRRAARARHGRDGAAVGASGRARRCPSTVVVGERDAKFTSRAAHGGSCPRASSVVAGRPRLPLEARRRRDTCWMGPRARCAAPPADDG